jgi:hypothetical protein
MLRDASGEASPLSTGREGFDFPTERQCRFESYRGGHGGVTGGDVGAVLKTAGCASTADQDQHLSAILDSEPVGRPASVGSGVGAARAADRARRCPPPWRVNRKGRRRGFEYRWCISVHVDQDHGSPPSRVQDGLDGKLNLGQSRSCTDVLRSPLRSLKPRHHLMQRRSGDPGGLISRFERRSTRRPATNSG